jgi:hypothetical protein
VGKGIIFVMILRDFLRHASREIHSQSIPKHPDEATLLPRSYLEFDLRLRDADKPAVPTPKKPTAAVRIQRNITIPPSRWPKIVAAMDYDGIQSFSQFALAAVNQRVARLERQKSQEEKSDGQA